MKEEEDKKYLELAGGRGNDSSNAYSGSQSMENQDKNRKRPKCVKIWSETDRLNFLEAVERFKDQP